MNLLRRRNVHFSSKSNRKVTKNNVDGVVVTSTLPKEWQIRVEKYKRQQNKGLGSLI